MTGEKGRNRVRVYTHAKSGLLYLEWQEKDAEGTPRKRTEALGHTNKAEAKAAAETKAQQLRAEGPVRLSGPLLLHELFDNFETARKELDTWRPVHGRAASNFLAWWGPLRAVASLDEHELQRYTHARTTGLIVRAGKTLPAVRARAVEEELTILRTVLRWAVRRKTDTGARLLRDMPILEWHIPREENPRRPQLAEAGYQALSQCAWAIDPRLWLALVVCHETGHRLNSVRQLRWGDIDETARTITWRGVAQKNKQQHVTPLTDTAAQAFALFRANDLHTLLAGASVETPVFYGGRSGGPVARDQFYEWWAKARETCPVTIPPGVGFHAFRRKLASELATAPLAMVKAIGGWKHPHIVVAAYQDPTLEQQRAVLDARAKFAAGQ
ncbi:MAG TPA: tyrosine-type recombinase/integrase [Gemmatimonas sp.]|uniref:tyrosine-type recombinase/integrase n=1 Tax=Gemmatimonas sp. TaxID=1962908 RepID=UPI002ED81318